MKWLCCLSGPELQEPLPAVPQDHGAPPRHSSPYLVPDAVKPAPARGPSVQRAPSGSLPSHAHVDDPRMRASSKGPTLHSSFKDRSERSGGAGATEPLDALDAVSDEDEQSLGKTSTLPTPHGGDGAPPPPPVGEEWRRWSDHPACADYSILSTLGRGAFADVYLGRHRATRRQHALKVVFLNKPGLKDKHIAVLQREGTYLRKLQHKNIVRCLRVYQAPQQWVFVLEHLKGGMLLNDLAKLKRYSEKTAAAVFKQIVSAVAYLHDNNIVHRDIKPENVVFKATVTNSNLAGKDNVVKLVDFGMILDLTKEPHSRGMMGSPGFVAPEVILGQYHTAQMDAYSLGVLLFVMLVGAKPMTQDQAKSMQYALMTPESLRGMHDPRWRSLSEGARDLVLKLLQPDPKVRYSARAALSHRWIKGAREESILDGSVMDGWADHVHLMHPAYMGSPSPYGNYAAASPHFNMHTHTAGMLSPHAGTHYSQKSGALRNPMGGSHSGLRPPPTPVSPLAMHMSNVPSYNNPGTPGHGHTLPDLGRTPTWGGHGTPRGHGTPMTAESNVHNPFAWTHGRGEAGGHSTALTSAPLNSHQFTDPAHKAVHDEVMKQAQEKLAQAQQFFMAAQAMRVRTSDSGRLPPVPPGGPATPTSSHSHSRPSNTLRGPPAPHGGNPAAAAPEADGSDLTQYTSRLNDHSLSAVAQSYMSTQNTPLESVSHAAHSNPGGEPPAGSGKAGAGVKASDFDAALNDAKNLMKELNQAPSLSHHQEEHQALKLAVGMLTGDQKQHGGGPGPGGSLHRTSSHHATPARSDGSRTGSAAAGRSLSAGPARDGVGRTPRRSSQRSDGAGVNILEKMIDDPARDAFYGAAGAGSGDNVVPPLAQGGSKGPAATRRTERRRSSKAPGSSRSHRVKDWTEA